MPGHLTGTQSFLLTAKNKTCQPQSGPALGSMAKWHARNRSLSYKLSRYTEKLDHFQPTSTWRSLPKPQVIRISPEYLWLQFCGSSQGLLLRVSATSSPPSSASSMLAMQSTTTIQVHPAMPVNFAVSPTMGAVSCDTLNSKGFQFFYTVPINFLCLQRVVAAIVWAWKRVMDSLSRLDFSSND